MKLQDYEILYDRPQGEYDPSGVGGIRTRTIRAGDILEVECYPITQANREARREAKRRRSTTAQARLNRRNAQRRMERLLEANFTPEDFVFTGTYAYPEYVPGFMDLDEVRRIYEADRLPWDERDAKRDVVNYLARVKRLVKKRGGDPKMVKYLYVIEHGKQPRELGLPRRYHFHGVISAPGLTARELKALWDKGFTQCDHFDRRHGGAARLSRYLSKQYGSGEDGQRHRSFCHSRNLKEPTVTVSDRKVSRRRAARVAMDVMYSGREIMEAIYPGYRCEELPEVRFSDFVAGAYIYAKMRRRD